MTDATTQFFEELGRRGHEPLLEKATGKFGFELQDNGRTDSWLVDVDKGDVTVSHKRGAADCMLRAEKAVFDGVAGGEVNATAAVLRGALALEGDWELMVLFQRLFPSPPRGSARDATAGKGRRKR